MVELLSSGQLNEGAVGSGPGLAAEDGGGAAAGVDGETTGPGAPIVTVAVLVGAVTVVAIV